MEWRGDKIVYSTTLADVATERTRIEGSFDSDAVRDLKAASATDLAIGGPTLAADAIRAGLVDEWHMFVTPILVGGGLAAWPGGVRIELDLHDERRFGNGTTYLRYVTKRPS